MSKTFDLVLRAWHNGEEKSRVNDLTDGTSLFFHHNKIATSTQRGNIQVSSCGFQSPSTNRRLNKIVPNSLGVGVKKGVLYVGRGEWLQSSQFLDITLLEKYMRVEGLSKQLEVIRELSSKSSEDLGWNSLDVWRQRLRSGSRKFNEHQILFIVLASNLTTQWYPKDPKDVGRRLRDVALTYVPNFSIETRQDITA